MKTSSSLKPQTQCFIYSMLQWHVKLYINPCNHVPRVKNGPSPGVLCPIAFQWENTKKSSPKPQGQKLSYFVCCNIFINPANRDVNIYLALFGYVSTILLKVSK